MLPLFNSLPYSHSNQNQANGTTASAPLQVMPSNQFQCNPSHLFPNSMQFQPQMGIANPQIAIPFNNSNTHLSNANITIPNRPSPCFMNVPNQILPFQNVMPHLGPQNMNSITANQMNSSQPVGQFFACNSMYPPQFFSQNQNIHHGQFCLQSPIQNVNPFVQMQMPNCSQVFPGNSPLCPSQVSQGMGPQNPAFAVNSQFGLVNGNGVVQHAMDVNTLKQLHNTTQQVRGNSPSPFSFGSTQPLQTQNFCPSVSTRSQGNPRKDTGFTKLNDNWKNSPKRNFSRNPKRDSSHIGVVKSQFPHTQNANGKFKSHNEHGAKGYNNNRARKSGPINPTNQTRVEKPSFLSLNYTEQEVQKWREERRKNYPSKSNMEKMLAGKLTEPEVTTGDAKLRRQQLKDILAKQAELGCEVAEIPYLYVSDSEQQVHVREENRRALSNKKKFQNKFSKRGRFRQNDRLAKKQKSSDQYSSNMHDQSNRLTNKQKVGNIDSSTRLTMNKEPTLLQKLLSREIRRDKSHLLQVFRFMVMNSFFKVLPLRFPLVIVRETGVEGEVVEEKSPNKKGVYEGCDKSNIEEFNGNDVKDNDENNHDDEDGDSSNSGTHHTRVKTVHFVGDKGSNEKGHSHEEEEGEIID